MNPVERKQSLLIYRDGKTVELEDFPWFQLEPTAVG